MILHHDLDYRQGARFFQWWQLPRYPIGKAARAMKATQMMWRAPVGMDGRCADF